MNSIDTRGVDFSTGVNRTARYSEVQPIISMRLSDHLTHVINQLQIESVLMLLKRDKPPIKK